MRLSRASVCGFLFRRWLTHGVGGRRTPEQIATCQSRMALSVMVKERRLPLFSAKSVGVVYTSEVRHLRFSAGSLAVRLMPLGSAGGMRVPRSARLRFSRFAKCRGDKVGQHRFADFCRLLF